MDNTQTAEPTKYTLTRIDVETLDIVRGIAKASERSTPKQLRHIVNEWVKLTQSVPEQVQA